jgi:hypothetical protein
MMNPEDRRSDSFLEHLSDSEKRLGAARHTLFDALFIGVILLVIVSGFTLGVMRIRVPRIEQATAPASAVAQSVPSTRSDDRSSRDGSNAGTPTVKDPKVGVEIRTLTEQERDRKLEELRKEGLLTEKEVEALKKPRHSR